MHHLDNHSIRDSTGFNGDWHKKWQWNLGINWQF